MKSTLSFSWQAVAAMPSDAETRTMPNDFWSRFIEDPRAAATDTGHHETESTAAVELRTGMRELWSDHMQWTSATVDAFFEACQGGDLARLTALLAPDVEFHSDGGGKVRAALRPILGAEKVIRYLLGVIDQYGDAVVREPALINGQYGALLGLRPDYSDAPEYQRFVAGRRYLGVVVPDVTADGRISRISYVVNPDKLRAVDGGSAVS